MPRVAVKKDEKAVVTAIRDAAAELLNLPGSETPGP